MAQSYICGQLMAIGSFGSVFRAKHTVSAQEVCLKIVPESRATLSEALNEVKLLASLSHPNILRFITSYRHQHCLVIVTELARGGDLATKIDRHKKAGTFVPEDEVWRICIDVCKGLEYLHDHRVLHRDLKPSNVFLDLEGRAVVGDLGMGRLLEPHERWATSGVGTPIYFSPELMAGRPYDERSDVWAFGCIAHELAALEPAFSALDFGALADQIMRASPSPLPAAYSIEYQYLVMLMTDKEPKKRPLTREILRYPAVRVRIELDEVRGEVARLRKQIDDGRVDNGNLPLAHVRLQERTLLPSTRDAKVPSTPQSICEDAHIEPEWQTPPRARPASLRMSQTVTVSPRLAHAVDTRHPNLNSPAMAEARILQRGANPLAQCGAMWSPGRLGPPLRVPRSPRK